MYSVHVCVCVFVHVNMRVCMHACERVLGKGEGFSLVASSAQHCGPAGT